MAVVGEIVCLTGDCVVMGAGDVTGVDMGIFGVVVGNSW